MSTTRTSQPRPVAECVAGLSSAALALVHQRTKDAAVRFAAAEEAARRGGPALRILRARPRDLMDLIARDARRQAAP